MSIIGLLLDISTYSYAVPLYKLVFKKTTLVV